MKTAYCPCGEKKRYSACCLLKSIPASQETTPPLKRLQAAYSQLWTDHLVPFIQARRPAVLAMAWEDCFLRKWPRKIERSVLLSQFLNYWLALTWRPYDRDGDKALTLGQSLIEQCYAASGEMWPRAITELMEALRQSYYSFYRITAIHRDGHYTVEDLLLQQTTIVQLYFPLSDIYVETVLLSRLIRWEGEAYLMETMPYRLPLTPTSVRYNYWQTWGMESGDFANTCRVEQLQQEDTSHQLIQFYLSLLQTLYGKTGGPLLNSNGEVIAPTAVQGRLHLTQTECLAQLNVLLKLEQSALIGATAASHLSAKPSTITIPWLAQQKKESGVVGWLRLTERSLQLDTETLEQSQQGAAFISQTLGKSITFQKALAITQPAMFIKKVLS